MLGLDVYNEGMNELRKEWMHECMNGARYLSYILIKLGLIVLKRESVLSVCVCVCVCERGGNIWSTYNPVLACASLFPFLLVFPVSPSSCVLFWILFSSAFLSLLCSICVLWLRGLKKKINKETVAENKIKHESGLVLGPAWEHDSISVRGREKQRPWNKGNSPSALAFKQGEQPQCLGL